MTMKPEATVVILSSLSPQLLYKMKPEEADTGVSAVAFSSSQSSRIFGICYSWRFVVVFITFLGSINEYSLRSLLSLVLVCMEAEYKGDNDTSILYANLTSNNEVW